jgi:DNA polymerase-3 subunit alpha
VTRARKRVGGFRTLFEFCEEVDTKIVNKRVIESLIKCGAFDGIGAKRAQLYCALPDALERATRAQREKLKDQASLFDLLEEEVGFKEEKKLPEVEEWSPAKLLKFEKELLGLYLTSHPLSPYDREIEKLVDFPISEIEASMEQRSVKIAGIFHKLKKLNTKGGRKMAVGVIEDKTGSIEVVIFPDIYEQEKENITEEVPVLLMGEVFVDEESPKIRANKIIPLEELKKTLAKEVHIALKTQGLEEDTLLRLRKILKEFSGKLPVYLHLYTPRNAEVVIRSGDSVSLKDGFIQAVEDLLGKDALILKE